MSAWDLLGVRSETVVTVEVQIMKLGLEWTKFHAEKQLCFKIFKKPFVGPHGGTG